MRLQTDNFYDVREKDDVFSNLRKAEGSNMDEKNKLHGWLAASPNLKIGCLGEYMNLGVCVQYSHLLNKFPQDQIFLSNSKQVCFLDGYVYNKEEFLCPEGFGQWSESFSWSLQKDRTAHFQKLRGAFCGYFYDKGTDWITAYTDHVSNKTLYYYAEKDRWILSDNLDFIVRVLRANGIEYHFDETAAKYMLTYGYMLDDTTFVKEIHRLLPGQLVCIKDGSVRVERYYMIPNEEVRMSEAEAVEKIDSAFREAVRREFEKDREYGYRHLVDLSGGLDSRMVSWVAHDMGYTDQLNVSYSRAGYLDEKISGRIARHLGHEYLFKPLDDIGWMYDIDEIVIKNNGAALYTGITGGDRLLKILSTDQFGIEHTGMIGDAVLSTFYHDRDFNYGKPRLGLHRYSERLPYTFSDVITREYPCQEMFAIYTRGMLGAQTSYIIRQHYVETASPFMDVDFLETVFSIPFAYRNGHHIYLKWMLQKYPGATQFGWEKWGGVKPRVDHIFFRKVRTAQRLLLQAVCKAFKQQNKDSMNPLDFWYQGNLRIQEYYRKYFDDNRGRVSGEVEKDIFRMFEEGNVTEKSMALTVLGAVKLYFREIGT